VRGGRPGLTSIYDVVVGDILILEPGDIVPVDAILTEGYGIRCDESSITGESHALKKVPADIALDNTSVGAQSTDSYDPFILSGSKVSEGVGRSLVTAVGPHSCYGRTMIGNLPSIETQTDDI
jgi:P-type Ca2+ transporter type 2C